MARVEVSKNIAKIPRFIVRKIKKRSYITAILSTYFLSSFLNTSCSVNKNLNKIKQNAFASAAIFETYEPRFCAKAAIYEKCL